MAGTSLPAAHHVAERFLSRGDVLGGDFRVKANTRSTIFGVRSVGPIVTDPASSRLILGLHCGSTGKRRASRTSGLSPYLARKVLTSANAAWGLSGCTGRAAYSGDTNVTEQPPIRSKRQGSRHPAAAGVTSITSTAIMMLRCNIHPLSPDGASKQYLTQRDRQPAQISIGDQANLPAVQS